jgi:DNA-binding beta-propeller fold protein YncE
MQVSIVDLNSLTANGSIPVGSRPTSIAINPKTNQALVTNRVQILLRSHSRNQNVRELDFQSAGSAL